MQKNDEDLIIEYINGNQNSLKVLIDRYTPQIYNFSVRFVGITNAPDITQDVWIKVWRNIKNFKVEKSHFKTWLFTIVRNTTTDYLRKKKSMVFSDLDTEDNNFEDTVIDDTLLPDKVLEKLEDKELLNKLLLELPINYQEVLTLYYQDDMTFKEIGEVLGKPLNTVKSHHYRALEQLKKMIL